MQTIGNNELLKDMTDVLIDIRDSLRTVEEYNRKALGLMRWKNTLEEMDMAYSQEVYKLRKKYRKNIEQQV